MTTTIRHKRITVSGYAPASLDDGEIAVNVVDGILFWKDSTNAIRGVPLENIVTKATLDAVLAGAPAALDTLNELAAAINNDANFASTVTTALGNRLRTDVSTALTGTPLTNVLTSLGLLYPLRGDVAQTSWTAAQRGQARFNIGKPTPLKISANLAAPDPNLSIEREHEFTGAYTFTAPAVANVFDGWCTGTFHNRGNGSIATANFVGTIAVPAGAYLNGTLNGTAILPYGCKGYLYYDAQATPNATWRFIYTDRNPDLYNVAFSAVASFDTVLPPGFSLYEYVFTNVFVTVNQSDIGFRVSADGGTTIRSTAYTAADNGQNAAAYTYAPVFLSMNNGAGTQSSAGGFASGKIEPKYCAALGIFGEIIYGGSAANSAYDIWSFQTTTTTPIANPNFLRWLVQSGAMSGNFKLKGVM